MPDTDFWTFVFSPRAMAIDAIAGLIAAILFRVLHGCAPRSPKAWLEMALIAMVLRHAIFGPSHARSMPTGYVGHMTALCLREASEENCLCAVDALRDRIGDTALVQLAVRAEVNAALPKEFQDALDECSG